MLRLVFELVLNNILILNIHFTTFNNNFSHFSYLSFSFDKFSDKNNLIE